jgi:hypothetical protein
VDAGILLDGRKFEYAEPANCQSIAEALRDSTQHQRPITSKNQNKGALRDGRQDWKICVFGEALSLQETLKARKEV